MTNVAVLSRRERIADALVGALRGAAGVSGVLRIAEPSLLPNGATIVFDPAAGTTPDLPWAEAALEIDFGRAAPDNRAMLVLNGWVDWADGSTFLGAAQECRELALPSLQVKDREGRWRTVIEDMGLPAGKPKTIVVDLAGKFLSASREVRILTNLCVDWDEIFLATAAAPPPVRLTPLQAAHADLSYRGFSRAVVDPARPQPEHFRYAEWSPTLMWNPTPGMYTRYGDVAPLVSAIDDRLVIMGSGDELR